jgi:hypothetical protein
MFRPEETATVVARVGFLPLPRRRKVLRCRSQSFFRGKGVPGFLESEHVPY